MQNKARLELADYEAVSPIFTLLELSSVHYQYTTDSLKEVSTTQLQILSDHMPCS